MSDNRREKSIPGYLYPLDGLRALSLILIFMFHTWQQSWIYYQLRIGPGQYLFNLEAFQRYGYAAIDTFFVLSGFGLFYPIARAMFGESKFGGWKNFFAKRLRRIYPSYFLMLIVLLIYPTMSWITNTITNPAEIAKHFFSHLFFVHNFSETTQGSMISTAWTMPIEVQFYLLFPLICIPFRKKPVLTFAGLCAVSVGLRLTLMCTTDISRMVIQAIPIGYLDVFGCGMLSAYFVVAARHRLKYLEKLKPMMTLLSLAFILAGVGYILWMSKMQFPQGVSGGDVYFRFLYRGLFAALMAAFLFTACYSCDFWQRKIWGNRFFVFLSSISYTVYLWHQNIYILLKRINIPYTEAYPVMNDRAAMEGMTLICIVSSLLIGVIVTKYVEGPIVKYGYKGCAVRSGKAVKGLLKRKTKTPS